METLILATKLYRPTPQGTVIDRPLLLAKLQQGLAGKLTIITAPAGFGKSTLVSQWVCGVGRPVAWLTLDEHDNEPARFLTYLIAACQQLHPVCGVQTWALLRASQPPPIETILTTLINELALMPQPFLLVLDDYHLLEAEAIQQVMNFLLTYLPPSVHLVIMSRREPPLALARLRVQGALVQLHTADLRFSLAEVMAFFTQVVGEPLTAELATMLDARTEGRAAGLRLAAIVLQAAPPAERRARFTALLTDFRGDDRHVFDYLTEEVFDRLDADRRQFLVQTALLHRLCGPLCDTVTGQHDSQTLLEELARDNLFLLPLDNQRQWYRYHPLFADFLRHRLQQLAPAQVMELHRRAAGWYAMQGFAEAAIDHAFAAQDLAQAAQLIEANVLRLALSNESSTLARWLRLLPPALTVSRPLLAFAHAGVALLTSQFDEASQWIATAENALRQLPPQVSLPVVGETLQGYLDAFRCTVMVNLHAPTDAIITVAERALTRLPADERFLRGAVALNLGDAYARQQESTQAADAFAAAIALTQDAGNLIVHLAALGSQGSLYERLGDLPRAAQIYQRAIELGQAWGKATGQSHPATGKVYAFYANLLCEWNRLTEAEWHASAAIDCCQRWGHTQHLTDSYLALINTLAAQAKWEAVAATLTTARLAAHEPWSRQLDQLQLSLWLRQGRLTEVSQWLTDHADESHSTVHFARLRLALAQNELAHATYWLTQLEQMRSQLSHVGQIKLWLLQAKFQQQAHPPAALVALRTALSLAERGGYVRVFLDEGRPLAELLHQLAQQEPSNRYVQMLLAAFADQGASVATPQLSHPLSALVEPLSEREWEVLRLMADDLTYEAIGERLFISLNTVRTHTKNIYSKLNVNRRSQAVARGRALGLL